MSANLPAALSVPAPDRVISHRARRALGAVLLALMPLGVGCDSADNDAPTTDVALMRAGAIALPGETLFLGAAPFAAGTDPVRYQLALLNRGATAIDLDGPPIARIEGDSDLAFRLARTRAAVLEPGTDLELTVLFSPPRAGRFEATLIVDSPNAAAGPQPYGLIAEATTEAIVPELGAAFSTSDGSPVTTLDVGSLLETGRAEAELRLRNTGNTSLPLTPSALVLTGDDDVFTATFGAEGPLEPGTEVTVTIGAASEGCGTFAAMLTFVGPEFTSLATVALSATSAPDRLDVPAITSPDTSVSAAHSLALALTSDGTSHVVLGESAAGTFTGAARFFELHPCGVGGTAPLTDPAPIGTNLWGHRAAITGDGALALVTWADRAEARLFRLDADGASVRLGTFMNDGGHGAAAALSGDGSVAVVGQRLADSGYNPHGGLWLYERNGVTWDDTTEARFRLVPLDPPRVAELGVGAAISESGELVVGAGLYMTSLQSPDTYEAALFVWRATRDPVNGRQWGRIVPGQDVDRRAESALLRTQTSPMDERIEVGIGDDGAVLALAFQTGPTVIDVHLFERAGDDLWGLPGQPASRRVANHVVTVTAFDAWGFALDPSGDRFFIADNAGLVAVRRVGASWDEGSTLDREWPTSMKGRIAIDRDGRRIVGLGVDDGIVLLEVGGEP